MDKGEEEGPGPTRGPGPLRVGQQLQYNILVELLEQVMFQLAPNG